MKIIKRRRIEGKTDFRRRLGMLKSEKARLVVRKSNRFVYAQIVVSDVAQDKVIVSVDSKMLLSKGWPKELEGSLKSLSASYLVGFLLGRMAKDKVSEAILDLGLNRNVQKSRIYAVLKGAVDSGLNIPHSEESLPTLEEIKSNKKLGKVFESVLSNL